MSACIFFKCGHIVKSCALIVLLKSDSIKSYDLKVCLHGKKMSPPAVKKRLYIYIRQILNNNRPKVPQCILSYINDKGASIEELRRWLINVLQWLYIYTSTSDNYKSIRSY